MAKTIFFCAVVVLAAKVLDFLLGRTGRRWIKDKLVFQPWFILESMSPLFLLRSAARALRKTIKAIFGPSLVSKRAYIASTVAGYAALALSLPMEFALGWTKFTSHESSLVVFLGSIYVINPAFDLCSFAITRRLAEEINSSERVSTALSYWLFDVASCIVLALGTYIAVDLFVELVEPGYTVSSWFGFETHGISVLTALTSAVPTLLHIIFALFFLLVSLAEGLRRIVRYLLERFDESDENPLALIATFFACLAGVFAALGKVASGS